MNLTGTLIYDGNGTPSVLVPLVDHPDLTRELMYVGGAQIPRSVSQGDCPKTKTGDVSVSANTAPVSKVEILLPGIRDKLRTDLGLTEA